MRAAALGLALLALYELSLLPVTYPHNGPIVLVAGGLVAAAAIAGATLAWRGRPMEGIALGVGAQAVERIWMATGARFTGYDDAILVAMALTFALAAFACWKRPRWAFHALVAAMVSAGLYAVLSFWKGYSPAGARQVLLVAGLALLTMSIRQGRA